MKVSIISRRMVDSVVRLRTEFESIRLMHDFTFSSDENLYRAGLSIEEIMSFANSFQRKQHMFTIPPAQEILTAHFLSYNKVKHNMKDAYLNPYISPLGDQ